MGQTQNKQVQEYNYSELIVYFEDVTFEEEEDNNDYCSCCLISVEVL